MGKNPPVVLMFLLVIFKMLGTAEGACSCTPSTCDCYGQGLTSVPQDLPTTITELDLTENQITTLSQSDFSRYRDLETIELDNNRISTINSQAFYSLSNLVTLYLSENRLTSLRSDMFVGLEKLQDVNFYTNYIDDIQAGTFNTTPQLRILELGDNRLTTIRSDMFTGLGKLQELNVNINNITNIQAGTFISTPQLGTLALHDNKLTNLRSDMFTGLGNLQRLLLYNNDISDIQTGTFNPTPQLINLFLYNNRIQSIPPNLLANLQQLRYLRFDYNNITTFPFQDLSKLQTISRLSLNNNQMSTLPSAAYDILSSISNVDIDNNPWQCDCRMTPFRLKMNGSYPFENQITCSQPSNFSGQNLIDIHPDDLGICEEPSIARFQRVANNPLVQGKPIYLVCEVSGIPTPSITVTLPSGLNATVVSDGRVTVDENGNIIIRDATSLDVGLYTCIATSPVGSTSAGLSIDVLDVEPRIVKFDSSVNTLGQRKSLSLVCEASGSPPPDITVILPSGLVTTLDVHGAVTITDVTAADSGLYVCIAVNVAGSTFSTLAVDLQTVQTTVLPSLTTIVTTPSKQPKSAPTFSQSVLLGAIFGSIAGTLIIVAIILTIWCKRNNQSPPKCPDFSVLFNNQTQKLTVLTNEYDLTHLKASSVNKSE
ncbi:PREDICTED: immunoglobulin superfamily member 10-like isoform X1 [Branchiostoma belcheri]|uniref:Immunoglobulin superfamily member 10-like isoform X1 n=2 Tax=Branchiostoma belcheri TaxID=7741 RepID=A0A6P5A7R1_BRABE|nr:PREDICTED: immunoglobulin superfamily member 10-like isoform X1 [Branchiostoma belcheri]